MKTITIDISHSAWPPNGFANQYNHFRPPPDDFYDFAPYEIDLMINGLDADIVALSPPGFNGNITGSVTLYGTITDNACEVISNLFWVIGITIV